MSYNVQNLFDELEDGNEYPEYRKGAWTHELFERKIECLGEVIKKAFPGGPDILVLQEVENRRALIQLRDRHLRNMGYRAIIIVPGQGSATNVAVISRLPVIRSRSHSLGSFKGKPLRSILELEIEYRNRKLYLFNNHWKSKTGGTRETEPARLKASAFLRKRIGEILKQDPGADIVVAGDFNDNVEEYLEWDRKYQTALIPAEIETSEEYNSSSVFLALNKASAELDGDRLVLYEPWYELAGQSWGSFVYRGRWQTPDHILLSAGLFDDLGFCYKSGSFRPMRSAFLLDSKTGYPKGLSAKKRPERKIKGYSDHLPLLITLYVN